MGTYTTNYNLFMPTVGEQGWGDLVNGNFTTIDTTMAGLNTRLTAVESEVNGNLSCTSVTTSGTITSTGLITANGGIGTKALTATSISNSGNMTNTGTLTCTGKIYANGGIEGAATSLSKVVTVTPTSNLPTSSSTGVGTTTGMLLPPIPGVTYSGSLKFYCTSEYYADMRYCTSPDKIHSPSKLSGAGARTITLDNVPMFYITYAYYMLTGSFTLS